MEKEKEEILENSRNVKDIATGDLSKEEGSENSIIQNVKYYGKVTLTKKDGEKEEIDLYTVEEYDSQTDKVKTRIYINGQKLDMEELMREYESFEPIKDLLEEEKSRKNQQNIIKENSLDKEERKIYDLNELEAEKEMEKYAKVAGINKKNVNKVTEVKDKEDKENQVDEKKLESVNHLQEIKGDTKVNNYETIAKAIGLTGVKKFVVVYSEDTEAIAKNNNKEIDSNNSKYSMIAVMNDGTVINIDDKLELNRSAGINGGNERIQTDADETTKEENHQASIYNIKGKNKSISIENDDYGEIQVYYGSMTKGYGENEGNQFVGTQLETSNVWPTSSKVREQEDKGKGQYNADKKAEEVKEHFKEHGEDEIKDIENADGDKNTQELCENEINIINKVVSEIMENETIDYNYSEKEVREYLLKVIEENPKMTQEEIKNYVESDLEQAAPVKSRETHN